MLGLSAVLVSFAAAAAVAGSPSSGGSDAADLCVPSETACDGDFFASDAARERLVAYATPAEVDCKAAVATVAVNSRADLQLDSGDCSPIAADYRFHISRLPDSASSGGGSVAPQKVRRNPRSASSDRATCNGVPEPTSPAVTFDGGQPVAVISVPGIMLPIEKHLTPDRGLIPQGRGSDPPDEPPKIFA